MCLEIANKLGSFVLNLVDLREFPIPEEGIIFAAIDTFDVHTQGHNDLIVRIG